MKSLSIAATGMLAQQLNVEVISNNLANMNTTGYKRQRAEFQDLLYQNIERIGATSSSAGTVVPNGIQIGVGVKAGSVYRVTDQGNMNPTGNEFDLGINGKGFFRIQLPSGEDAYTRAGNFAVSPEGQLVTAAGYVVQPSITIPQEAIDVNINEEGQVEVVLPNQAEPSQIGQLELGIFFNEAGLESIGDNLLMETAASGTASLGTPGDAGYGKILQGFVETANVDAVQEITALIAAQRAYEMNAKVITTSDEMLSVGSNLK
ncbi:MAG: flagellar basal-body rod protein FlgG [Pseudomonadota bacterium]